jgi:hypothetical protein
MGRVEDMDANCVCEQDQAQSSCRPVTRRPLPCGSLLTRSRRYDVVQPTEHEARDRGIDDVLAREHPGRAALFAEGEAVL